MFNVHKLLQNNRYNCFPLSPFLNVFFRIVHARNSHVLHFKNIEFAFMSQFVVDNRQLPYQDFHIDASYASYQRNVSSLIGKYCTLSGLYSWLQHPAHIAFALSPDKVRLVPKSQWSIAQISALFGAQILLCGFNSHCKIHVGYLLRGCIEQVIGVVSKATSA